MGHASFLLGYRRKICWKANGALDPLLHSVGRAKHCLATTATQPNACHTSDERASSATRPLSDDSTLRTGARAVEVRTRFTRYSRGHTRSQRRAVWVRAVERIGRGEFYANGYLAFLRAAAAMIVQYNLLGFRISFLLGLGLAPRGGDGARTFAERRHGADEVRATGSSRNASPNVDVDVVATGGARDVDRARVLATAPASDPAGRMRSGAKAA